jgi:hypothetical protein
MPFYLTLLVLAVAALLWVRRRRQRGAIGLRPCRWVKTHSRRVTGLREFRCAACGQTGYSMQDKGPSNCLKGLSRGDI